MVEYELIAEDLPIDAVGAARCPFSTLRDRELLKILS